MLRVCGARAQHACVLSGLAAVHGASRNVAHVLYAGTWAARAGPSILPKASVQCRTCCVPHKAHGTLPFIK